jgi:plastocyanin
MRLMNAIRMIEWCKKIKGEKEMRLPFIMGKKFFSLVLILLTIALSGCTLKFDEPANNTSLTPIPTVTPTPYLPEQRTVYVEIFGSAFNPPELKVVNGTIVQWINKDSSPHAIYINNISSPVLNKRDKWNYTFIQPGTFEYNCTMQTWMKHGRIIVR